MDVQNYLNERSALIQEDRSLRRDRIRYAQATDDEKKADTYVRAIRSVEAKSVWGIPHDNTSNVYPGMEFLTGMVVESHFEELRSHPLCKLETLSREPNYTRS